jgi:trk system potassium uptake protein TrkH
LAPVILDPRLLAWVLGGFAGVLTAAMAIPTGYALLEASEARTGLLEAMAAGAFISTLLLLYGRRREQRELRQREAILLVVLVWVGVCLLGALPFYFSGPYDGFADAVFESTSGFTTTGATVIADVDGLPRALHLWRALSHWLGGMGIVLLGLAVLPLLGQGGSGLYRAEFSGAGAERLRPRIVGISRALWRIYLALTLALFGLLWLAGMSAFDAICHAFSTLATGGFSTRTASIAAFDSALIEYLVAVFMILSGVSFIQHYRLWIRRDPGSVARDYELRAYLWLIALATALLGPVLLVHEGFAWEPGFRAALFQVVSIVTTTGFTTADYSGWHPLAQFLLLVLMFIGGSTGSTAGGLKVARAVLMLRVVQREFRRIAEPQAVFRVRLNGSVVSEPTISALLNLVFLAWWLLLLATLVLTATGLDILTAVSAVVACQFNIGPGLGTVGPAEHYGHLTGLAKWVLSFCMIAGRLEFYTLLVVLSAAFWRR